MRQIFAILAFAFAMNAHASTNTSEITDMWFVAAESGWGVNIILQNGVAFATFFVRDTNHNPVWYTAELHYQGNLVWSGGYTPQLVLGLADLSPRTQSVKQARRASRCCP